jgi:hypothetical protein
MSYFVVHIGKIKGFKSGSQINSIIARLIVSPEYEAFYEPMGDALFIVIIVAQHGALEIGV